LQFIGIGVYSLKWARETGC